ncbi:deoxyribose-phosphate aldolase [Flavobacterium sp. xlx-214]|uniref:deoxyribose-phosphate aldolase n=1 Tax=unclassified Flavobacterium TaxID=196869 RepID=UPI0013D0E784|nr:MULTISPECIES: deoxyribose-phosphate aldolase [unclassified Flavobacterium]MBA5792826.1 deoxyribose-phosphate aldolase [Flavobacterium sp. xlx-221]QMI83961.1 deoxyribose-phosphate aldolase [Flavobacterium sp. xlx-214]
MKNYKDFIEASYLKTTKQAFLTEEEHEKVIDAFLNDVLVSKYKVAMVLPKEVAKTKLFLSSRKSKVLVGTVIDFPKGKGGLEKKLNQASLAIQHGAEELDFVVDYASFKKGAVEKVQAEIKECTAFVLSHNKTIKWILETAALTNKEIIQLTALIKNTVIRNFKETDYAHVYVKSSTGFYKTKNNEPNGATPYNITLLLENATPLPVKASGGIKNLSDVLFYLSKGVSRIGTSSQQEILAEIKNNRV